MYLEYLALRLTETRNHVCGSCIYTCIIMGVLVALLRSNIYRLHAGIGFSFILHTENIKIVLFHCLTRKLIQSKIVYFICFVTCKQMIGIKYFVCFLAQA